MDPLVTPYKIQSIDRKEWVEKYMLENVLLAFFKKHNQTLGKFIKIHAT